MTGLNTHLRWQYPTHRSAGEHFWEPPATGEGHAQPSPGSQGPSPSCPPGMFGGGRCDQALPAAFDERYHRSEATAAKIAEAEPQPAIATGGERTTSAVACCAHPRRPMDVNSATSYPRETAVSRERRVKRMVVTDASPLQPDEAGPFQLQLALVLGGHRTALEEEVYTAQRATRSASANDETYAW